MKTSWLVGLVASAHVLAVAAIMMVQGCGTPRRSAGLPPEPVMPPSDDVAIASPTSRLQPVRVPHHEAGPTSRMWPADTTIYTVRRGESLSKIAGRYGLSVAEITALNGISDPNKVRVGQRLVLPGKLDVTKAPASPSRPSRTRVEIPAGATSYEVRPGDSLSLIAVRAKTSVRALKQANSMTSDRIIVGQKLVLPSGATPVSMPPVALPEGPELPVAPANPGLDVMELEVPALELGPDPVEVPEAPELSLPEPVVDAPPVTPTKVRIHVVEPGEDVYSVAMMWGVSVSRIKDVNGLTDNTLKTGQRLKIPLDE